MFIALTVKSIENLKTLKYRTLILSRKTLVLSIICDQSISQDEKIFKERESIKMLKIRLIKNKEEHQKNV